MSLFDDTSLHTNRRTGSPSFSTQELNQPAALASFVDKFCHEIDNPLTAIISMASVIQRLGPDLEAEKQSSYTQSISQEAWRVTKQIQKLALLIGSKESTYQSSDATNALRSSLAKVRDEDLFCDIDVKLEIPNTPLSAQINKDKLEILFFELLENAHLAALSLVDDKAGDAPVGVGLRESDESIECIIYSRCAKSEQKELSELFQPFITGSDDAKHSGLGLTVAWSIIENCGGSIELEELSYEDCSKFVCRFKLPKGGAVAKEEKNDTPSSDKELSTISVLIIDDEDVVSSAMQKIIEVSLGKKYTVHCYRVTGLPAIELLKGGERFSAIFCDLNLRDTNGRHIFEVAHQHCPDMIKHFAFVTGDSHNPETKSFLESTGQPYLLKPFEHEELVETVLRLAKAE